MADVMEITKEIVIKMIEQGKILTPKIDQSNYNEQANLKYNEEVCKAFKTVHKTVNDTWNGK